MDISCYIFEKTNGPKNYIRIHKCKNFISTSWVSKPKKVRIGLGETAPTSFKYMAVIM